MIDRIRLCATFTRNWAKWSTHAIEIALRNIHDKHEAETKVHHERCCSRSISKAFLKKLKFTQKGTGLHWQWSHGQFDSAVSKTFSADVIEPVIEGGMQGTFGENRVQEAQSKWPESKAKDIPTLNASSHWAAYRATRLRNAVERCLTLFKLVDREKDCERPLP